MNFVEAESYLLSLGNEVAAMKLGLDNIRKLLTALGDPKNNFLKVQVAGTNGKGSVCAFLNSICLEANIKTGVFTSPHLVSITERININGRDISEKDFARHATLVRDTSEKLVASGVIENTPTFFEQITAIALVTFAEANVELAILETGLGGRLDATTAANAEIAAITRIDLDHQQYLGDTIEEIAAEKAAIIRADSIAIVAEQSSEPSRVIVEHCKRVGVTPRYTDFVSVRQESGKLIFATDFAEYAIEKLGLAGHHQIDNAKVALLVAEELARRSAMLQRDITCGLENALHSGRLEYVDNFLLDGAHNVGGAKALRDFLVEFETRPITMIFGAMKDKNVAEVIEILAPKAKQIVFTKPYNERAITAKELEKFVGDSFDRDRVFLTDAVADALSKATKVAGKDGIILITGSLYLVGEAKKILNN